MGYSCSTKAMESFDQIVIQLKAAGKKTEGSNTWGKNGIVFFHEIGREQKDGAVVGSVTKIYDPVRSYCKKAGSFRVESNGKITRFPTSTKIQRKVAEIAAKAEIEKRGNIFSVI